MVSLYGSNRAQKNELKDVRFDSNRLLSQHIQLISLHPRFVTVSITPQLPIIL